MKDDVKRPYKAYAAVVSAILMSLVTNEALNWPPYVVALMTAAVAGLAVFMMPNPKSDAS